MKKCRRIKTQHVEFLKIELSLESFYQVGGQLLLALLVHSATPTVGGVMTSECWPSNGAALVLSILLGIKSCSFLHLKTIMIAKGYLPTKAKFAVFFWGLAATLRRLLAITIFFVPSMGLSSLLYHHLAEQLPYSARLDQARAGTMAPDDLIALNGLTENIKWSELDRWDYTNPEQPEAPSYSLYTGLSLKHTFVAFFVVMLLQFLILFMFKMLVSKQFRKATILNRTVHVLETINIPVPFRDWDHDDEEEEEERTQDDLKARIEEYKRRYTRVEREMIGLYIINTAFMAIMMVPLWYTGTAV